MKLQNIIAMLGAQLREEEHSYEMAVNAHKQGQAKETELRIQSLRRALNKLRFSAENKEDAFVSSVEFRLL